MKQFFLLGLTAVMSGLTIESSRADARECAYHVAPGTVFFRGASESVRRVHGYGVMDIPGTPTVIHFDPQFWAQRDCDPRDLRLTFPASVTVIPAVVTLLSVSGTECCQCASNGACSPVAITRCTAPESLNQILPCPGTPQTPRTFSKRRSAAIQGATAVK